MKYTELTIHTTTEASEIISDIIALPEVEFTPNNASAYNKQIQNIQQTEKVKMEQVIGKEEGDMLSAENISLVKQMAQHVAEIRRLVAELVERRKVANRISSERDKAIAYHDTVAPMLEEIRGHIDQLELVVDNELWTLPKYRELLFIV